MTADTPRPFWVYGRGEWVGRRPIISSDEFGRCTLVLPFIVRTLVIAIPAWIHRCPED